MIIEIGFVIVHLRRGNVSYLTSTICKELIVLMGQAVLTSIVNEMKEAKYYSVSIESTPDISHIDQLPVTVRYVNKSGPIERFLTFINFQIHTGQELARLLLSYLDDNGIDIANCRG